MRTLATQRCQRHDSREAVARCPVCQGYFCRECVVEHDDAIICSMCLANVTVNRPQARSRLGWIPRLLGSGLGFGVLIVIFYTMGRALVYTPSSFHEGTIWKKSLWSDDSEDFSTNTAP